MTIDYELRLLPTFDPDVVDAHLLAGSLLPVARRECCADAIVSEIRADMICRYVLEDRYGDLAPAMKGLMAQGVAPGRAAITVKRAVLLGESL